MEYVGNFNANAYFEYSMDPCEKRLSMVSSVSDRRRFIDKKYIYRKWVPQGEEDPIKIFKRNQAKGIYPTP